MGVVIEFPTPVPTPAPPTVEQLRGATINIVRTYGHGDWLADIEQASTFKEIADGIDKFSTDKSRETLSDDHFKDLFAICQYADHAATHEVAATQS